MDRNYSIDEILSAVDEIQNKKKKEKKKASLNHSVKKDYSDVPKHTLKLIGEAEEIKSGLQLVSLYHTFYLKNPIRYHTMQEFYKNYH